jgi:hypothetical protein
MASKKINNKKNNKKKDNKKKINVTKNNKKINVTKNNKKMNVKDKDQNVININLNSNNTKTGVGVGKSSTTAKQKKEIFVPPYLPNPVINTIPPYEQNKDKDLENRLIGYVDQKNLLLKNESQQNNLNLKNDINTTTNNHIHNVYNDLTRVDTISKYLLQSQKDENKLLDDAKKPNLLNDPYVDAELEIDNSDINHDIEKVELLDSLKKEPKLDKTLLISKSNSDDIEVDSNDMRKKQLDEMNKHHEESKVMHNTGNFIIKNNLFGKSDNFMDYKSDDDYPNSVGYPDSDKGSFIDTNVNKSIFSSLLNNILNTPHDVSLLNAPTPKKQLSQKKQQSPKKQLEEDDYSKYSDAQVDQFKTKLAGMGKQALTGTNLSTFQLMFHGKLKGGKQRADTALDKLNEKYHKSNKK